MNTKHTIPALDKAVRLLEYLGQTEGGAAQAELAEELGISASTCYRIIQTLWKHDWLNKRSGNRYDLSGGILTVATKLFKRLARFEHCQPLLNGLAEETGLTVKLSIRQGSEQVTILGAESPRPLSVSCKVGARFPVIEGSVGAALLCEVCEEDIRELAAECSEDIPERQDIGMVLARVDAVRTTGCCRNGKENRWHIDAMSAPMRDREGSVIAALTLLGVSADFEDDGAARLRASLLSCAGEVPPGRDQYARRGRRH